MLAVKYPINLVVIDDDSETLDLVRFYLNSKEEFNCHYFESAKEGLNFIKNNEVKLVLLDINMDEMQGDQVLREINSLQEGIQVIIVSASDNLINFTACYQEHARGFIFKPFTKEYLLETVDRTHEDILRWDDVFHKVLRHAKLKKAK